MKKILSLLFIVTIVSCKKDFLDVSPKGQLSQSQVASGTEQLVTAAYSSLGNDHYYTPWSLWNYGSVRSGDAYKGGRDESDIQEFYFGEIFVNQRSDLGNLDGQWFQYYTAISRVNAALTNLNNVSETDYPSKKAEQAEMRFLRGHWYFQLKILFKYIPFIDETVNTNNYANISNRALSNDSLWERIAADFQFALTTLPKSQSQVGRPTNTAAAA